MSPLTPTPKSGSENDVYSRSVLRSPRSRSGYGHAITLTTAPVAAPATAPMMKHQ